MREEIDLSPSKAVEGEEGGGGLGLASHVKDGADLAIAPDLLR